MKVYAQMQVFKQLNKSILK